MIRSLSVIALLFACVFSALATDIDAVVVPEKIEINSAYSLPPQLIPNDLSLYQQKKNLVQGVGDATQPKKRAHFSLGEIRKHQPITDVFDPIDKHQFENIVGGSAGVQLGRFSAQTGLIDNNPHDANSMQFFVQGSYTVLQKESLNIAVMAKLEAFENMNSQFESYDSYLDINGRPVEKAKNATLGFIGSYSLSPQWAIVGSILSSQSDKSAISAFEEDKTNHSAVIGTTYSF